MEEFVTGALKTIEPILATPIGVDFLVRLRLEKKFSGCRPAFHWLSMNGTETKKKLREIVVDIRRKRRQILAQSRHGRRASYPVAAGYFELFNGEIVMRIPNGPSELVAIGFSVTLLTDLACEPPPSPVW